MLKGLPFLGNERIKITTKFTVLFIIIGIIPLAFSGVISYTIYQRDIQRLTINSAISNVEFVRSDIEALFGGAERFLRIGETQWPMLFFEAAEDRYNFAKELLNVYDYYRTSYDNNSLIRNIYVIGLNGRCLSERRGIYYNHKSFINSSRYLSRILENGREITVIPEHIPNYDKLPSDEIVVSMGTVLYNNITFEPYGVVVLDLDPAKIKELYMDYSFIDVGRISLLYSDLPPDNLPSKISVYWEDIEAEITPNVSNRIISIDNEPYLFVNSDTKFMDLNVLGLVSVKELFSGVYTVRAYTIFSLLISAVLIVLVYIIISVGLMRPLVEIQGAMHQAADGDLDAVIPGVRGNMIPDLYASFDKMLRDLKEYVLKIDEEHRKYLDAELRVLQEQINPHFLYNTLDTILWSAVSGGNNEIVELVSEMSKFFRLSLSKGADYVTIRDEINCITSYLNIQQIRYHEILEFEIMVEEDLLDYRVLKLALQPLVENALYHGIKTKRGKGTITVIVKKSNDRILFSVRDDGAGMNEKRLAELRMYLEDPAEHMGIESIGVGLLNVQNRIMIKYDKLARLTVESIENEGTAVYFSLPYESR
ncbi:MAG: sensor histidine kinase [Spirochaetales bacterium]|uniref:histidine kinase n=1 Tax=Candidatus Thalassospirochaeta sargassi TaxID=3119039 RepID=A0AAJ1MKX9_9SPIO|nr:sensor histidine kinase [Spirochaetales bacterium]